MWNIGLGRVLSCEAYSVKLSTIYSSKIWARIIFFVAEASVGSFKRKSPLRWIIYDCELCRNMILVGAREIPWVTTVDRVLCLYTDRNFGNAYAFVWMYMCNNVYVLAYVCLQLFAYVKCVCKTWPCWFSTCEYCTEHVGTGKCQLVCIFIDCCSWAYWQKCRNNNVLFHISAKFCLIPIHHYRWQLNANGKIYKQITINVTHGFVYWMNSVDIYRYMCV